MKLRLATRGSALAMAQSRWVADRLRERSPGLEIEFVTIETSGDALPSERWAADGTKGLFVKEIEEALLRGAADCAVHSAKDLPASQPGGLILAAYPARGDARDVLVTKSASLADLPAKSRVATASERRRLQIRRLRPDLECVALRGNVDTRLRKLSEGQCEALVLAAAGLIRLSIVDLRLPNGHPTSETTAPLSSFIFQHSNFYFEYLDPSRMVPAPGQGALAVEACENRHDVLELLRLLDHPPTRTVVECERSFMRTMGGGCRMPLGAHSRLEGDELVMDVFYADSPDSAGTVLSGRSKVSESEELVSSLARNIREIVGLLD